MNCEKCQKEVFLPFKCPYCGNYYCSEHRLPENHDCPNMEQVRAPKEETQTAIIQGQKPYEYTITYTPSTPTKSRSKIYFSPKEITHLALATLLVIAVGLSFGMFSDAYTEIGGPLTLITFTIILTASFFTHEMAHKITAQRKQLWAEFRLTLMGAILTLMSTILPFFKIISPGAVMVAGLTNKENMGKISIAGPATNIAFSTVFLAIALLTPQYDTVFLLGAAINAWIALFNLIPFGALDGFKIFLWDKKIWVLVFAASIVLTIFSYKLFLDAIYGRSAYIV
jgi:Zn-dependent protease